MFYAVETMNNSAEVSHLIFLGLTFSSLNSIRWITFCSFADVWTLLYQQVRLP